MHYTIILAVDPESREATWEVLAGVRSIAADTAISAHYALFDIQAAVTRYEFEEFGR